MSSAGQPSATVPVPTGLDAIRMIDLTVGFTLSQAIYVAAKFDVATALTGGPLPVAALAERSGARPDLLRRILRTLAAAGIFAQPEPGVFALQPMGATLVARDEGSVRDAVIMFMETQYAMFGRLVDTVRTGTPAAQLHYGQPYFDYLASEPEQLARFTKTMAMTSSAMLVPLLDSYQLPPGETVADIGGADGTLLAHFLDTDPSRRGLLFDRPQVVGLAEQLFAERGLSDRVEVVAGDFFDSLPGGVDIYVLKQILHDWSDEECRVILRNVAAAARPGARVLIIDMVVPDEDVPHQSKSIDLVIMGALTGKERTREEFRALLLEAGIVLDDVVATPSFSVLEATVGPVG